MGLYAKAGEEKIVRVSAPSATLTAVLRLTRRITFDQHLRWSWMAGDDRASGHQALSLASIDTGVIDAAENSAFGEEEISPMTHVDPAIYVPPADVYELADRSDAGSIGGESFKTAFEVAAVDEDGDVDAKAAAAVGANRLDLLYHPCLPSRNARRPRAPVELP